MANLNGVTQPGFQEVKVNTPHAAVLLWNYTDRIEPNGAFSVNGVDEVVISTLSLMNISTNKTKSAPAGTFEFTLAPTKNWVKAITPGSWFVVLMSANTKLQQKHFQKADPSVVKFFGRVDGVVVNVGVDQETGVRMTTYTVVGSDWGQIFNSVLYVDPAARNPNDSAISTTGRFVYDNYLADISYDNATGLPTSTTNVKKLIELWGTTNTVFSNINTEISPNTTVIVKPEISFQVPQQVQQFFGFPTNKLTQIVANNLRLGRLTGYDTYQSEADADEAVGIIAPNSIFGTHTFWQVLQDNCNHVINELVTDIRWEPINADGSPTKNAKPILCLYKRVRPFIVRSDYEIYKNTTPGDVDQQGNKAAPDKSIIGPIVSRFENVRRITIPLENVKAISAGTNWRDKYNYAEMQIDHSLFTENFDTIIKINSSVFDPKVFGREGFKPMIAQTKYMPSTPDGAFDPLKVFNWKYILKEWYFDTHNMLNGEVSLVGMDTYIQVGDNILIDADVLGISSNINTANSQNKRKSYLLAHVESVSHSFSVTPEDGARTFSTTVQFVRGIITDSTGKQFRVGTRTQGTGRIDVNASINKVNEPNTVNVFSTSGNLDPDTKVNGQ